MDCNLVSIDRQVLIKDEMPYIALLFSTRGADDIARRSVPTSRRYFSKMPDPIGRRISAALQVDNMLGQSQALRLSVPCANLMRVKL